MVNPIYYLLSPISYLLSSIFYLLSSMNDIVIKAENLGKKYLIGHQAENGRYTALRDVLMQNARTLWNKTKDLAQGSPSFRATRWKKCGRSMM